MITARVTRADPVTLVHIVRGTTDLPQAAQLWCFGTACSQLINGNGNHASTAAATEDFLPPALDITLTIRTDKKPEALLLQPAGRALDFTWENGIATVTVDRVDIHDIVEVIG